MGDTKVMQHESQTLVRYGPPNIHDHHPYGTRVIVYKGVDEIIYDLWVQLSNQDEPKWEYMGEFRKDDKPLIESIPQEMPD